MKKGINALEIIFGLFVLIIVVLVIIKMFTGTVNVEPVVKEVDKLKEQYDYQQAEQKCKQICSEYQLGDCDITKAIKFCKEKVQVDLDGNNEPGEKSTGSIEHGAVILGMPYCEDGYYCFHVVDDCGCGSIELSPDTCDALMCEYYMTRSALTEDESKRLIETEVNTGTCEFSTKDDQFSQYNFIDRDTVMESGKNWFDLFGMGDCELGTGVRPGSTDFSIYIKNCDVTVSTDGKLGNYDCDVEDVEGTCKELMTVNIVDGDDNILMAMKGDIDKGKIELTADKLTGDAAFDLDAGTDPIDVTTGCATFLFTCGEKPYEALICNFV